MSSEYYPIETAWAHIRDFDDIEYEFGCFDTMPIMLNSLIPRPGTIDQFYNIPGWGVRIIETYIGLCPVGYHSEEGQYSGAENVDSRIVYNLDKHTNTRKVYEIIRPQKIFCIRSEKLLKMTLTKLMNVIAL